VGVGLGGVNKMVSYPLAILDIRFSISHLFIGGLVFLIRKIYSKFSLFISGKLNLKFRNTIDKQIRCSRLHLYIIDNKIVIHFRTTRINIHKTCTESIKFRSKLTI
jgi:hypothetical protein